MSTTAAKKPQAPEKAQTWGEKLNDKLKFSEDNRVEGRIVIKKEEMVWEDDFFVRSALVISSMTGFKMRTLHSFIGEILPGGKTGKHRHTSEAIMLGLAGKGYTVIEGKRYDWNEGDAIVMPAMAWHQHFNASDDTTFRYYATSNYPLTENLGIAFIELEEAGSHHDGGQSRHDK
ncbi:MAG: cupin domain-containing protein [Pseudorhodoplanes sp.]